MGHFFPTRQLKIGCLDRDVAESLIKSINLNVRGY